MKTRSVQPKPTRREPSRQERIAKADKMIIAVAACFVSRPVRNAIRFQL